MAKQKTNTPSSAGDANLIKGAKFAAQGYTGGVGGDFMAEYGMKKSQELKAQRQAVSQAADQRMSGFMESMPANVDIAKVPSFLQEELNSVLIESKEEYFRAAQIAANAGPRSPQYAEAMQTMNKVQQVYQNLNNDLSKLQKTKLKTMEDFELGSISNGTDPSAKDFLSRLTTDELDVHIDPATGRLNLDENGMTLDNIPKLNYKDHKTAGGILELSNTLYNQGQPLDKGREQIVRMQIQNMLDQGGPDAVLSAATDDHIIPGGLGIDPSQYTPTELKQVVVDQYVKILSDQAQSGYSATLSEERRKDARTLQRSISLAEKKKEAGLTTSGNLTDAERRAIDAADRASVSQGYMETVMSGDTSPLIGGQYAGQRIVGASFVGAQGVNAKAALEEAGFSSRDIRNFEASPDEMLIITDKSFYVVDPYNNAVNKDLNRAIIVNKFGNDATTDAAIMEIEKAKPVLPVLTGPMPFQG